MKRPVLALAVTLLAACGRQDGEGWAKSKLGEEGAEEIRRDAVTLNINVKAQIIVAGVPAKRVYLRRPFVVLQRAGFEGTKPKLVYPAMNKNLRFDLAKADDVKGIVVVQPDEQKNSDGQTVATEWDVVLIDRTTRAAVVGSHVKRADDILDAVDALPAE